MAVNVGELHTDVSTASAGAGPTGQADRERLGAAEERWQESRCLAERLAGRVRAEGFDD